MRWKCCTDNFDAVSKTLYQILYQKLRVKNFVFRKKQKNFKNVTIVTDISLGIKYTEITKEQNTKTIQLFS